MSLLPVTQQYRSVDIDSSSDQQGASYAGPREVSGACLPDRGS